LTPTPLLSLGRTEVVMVPLKKEEEVEEMRAGPEGGDIARWFVAGAVSSVARTGMSCVWGACRSWRVEIFPALAEL
jgi:hypothetical protein